MKVIVHGDLLPSYDICDELGISVQQEVNGTTVLIFPDTVKVNQGVNNREQIHPYNESYSALCEYEESGDNSLSDIIVSGIWIIGSGSLKPVDKKDQVSDIYECNGPLRLYKRRTFSTTDLSLSGEIDINGYYDYLNNMLTATQNNKVL